MGVIQREVAKSVCLYMRRSFNTRNLRIVRMAIDAVAMRMSMKEFVENLCVPQAHHGQSRRPAS